MTHQSDGTISIRVSEKNTGTIFHISVFPIKGYFDDMCEKNVSEVSAFILLRIEFLGKTIGLLIKFLIGILNVSRDSIHI